MTHCALCVSFTTKDHAPHKAVGLGVCKQPTSPLTPITFYPAGAPACPSFSAAEDASGARAAFLRKFQEVV